MNAVDLAEQLVAIGRQVQQVEQQLRQPVVVLESFTRLAELFVDPAVRLSALIAPHIHPSPSPRPMALLRLRPPNDLISSRFHYLPYLGQRIFQRAVGRWVRRANRSQAAADLDRDFDPRSPPNVLETMGAQHTPTGVPVSGVRLTRDRTSLLSLLQSNIQSTSAQPTSPASVRQPALRAVTTEFGDGAAGNRQLATVSKPPVNWDIPWTTENWRRAETPAGDETSSRSGMTGGEPEREAFGDFPTQIRRDGIPSSADGAGSVLGWAGIDGSHEAIAPLVQAVSDRTRQAGVPISEIAAEQSGFDRRLGVIPSALEDVMIWDDPARAPATLSAMQVDQILDALDERLELLLLRAYGAAS